MDPQFNATKGIGIQVTDGMLTTYNLLQDPGDSSAMDAIVHTKWDGLDLLPGHIDLSGAEVELADVEGRENRLKEAMPSMDGSYEYILLDTPPSLSLLTVNVFSYAAEVLVPCQTHPYAYDALEDLFDTISVIREEINPALRITGIVPTFYDSRTRVSRNVLERLKTHERYGRILFKTIVRANTTIAESAEACKPAVFFRAASFGALDYMALGKELIDNSSV
jgi:chromosome partitioning protein